jgi:uncharacterized RDD family membrane protein YckC
VSADTQAAEWVTSQGHYAGSVSRFAAYVIDLAVSAGLFALGLAGTSLVAQVVTGHQVSWSRTNIVVAVIFVAWEFFYFGYSWAVSGRTFGMAVLGVQREHRALHDLIAGTAVIYAWDARAARLRFLARQADVGATSSSRRGAGVPVPSAAGDASRASSGDR